jgi:BCD family chlorophyll transporter-like MFS transporter
MVCVALAGTAIGGPRWGSMRFWTIGGCIASAVALLMVAVSGFHGAAAPLRACVFALGVANGAFAVAAIGSMMNLVDAGRESREGVRMGLWGAAQAIAFGLGSFLGTMASDVARYFMRSPVDAYAAVFAGEALLFLVSAALAAQVVRPGTSRTAFGVSAAVAGNAGVPGMAQR